MGEETLGHAIRICIEGPWHLTDETLQEIYQKLQKSQKKKNSTELLNIIYFLFNYSQHVIQ